MSSCAFIACDLMEPRARDYSNRVCTACTPGLSLSGAPLLCVFWRRPFHHHVMCASSRNDNTVVLALCLTLGLLLLLFVAHACWRR